jgi:uncharacterized protein YqgC (DUF456 family)
MRPTTFIGLAALVVVGIIVADALAHPAGVNAAGAATVNLLTPTYGALLGNLPKGYVKAG